MGLRRALARILRPARRPKRGTRRLVADLAAFEQLTAPALPPARVRLAQELGTELVRRLEAELDLEGRLVPGRTGGRRLYRAA